MHLGDPFDEATTLGPLNNEPTAAKMDRHIADAVDRGAEVVLGGGRAAGYPTDLYYEYTLLDGVTPRCRWPARRASGRYCRSSSATATTRSLRLANDTELGLQAAVFTSGPEPGVPVRRAAARRIGGRQRVHRLLRGTPSRSAAPPAPRTGWGRVGIGEFTDLQTLVIDLGGGS